MNKNMESKQYKNKNKYPSFFYKGKHSAMKHSQHANENGSGAYSNNNNNGNTNFLVGNSGSSYMYKKRYTNYNSSYNDMKHNVGSSYNHDEVYSSERKGVNSTAGGGSHTSHNSRSLYKYNNGNNSNNNGNRYGTSYGFKKREDKPLNANLHNCTRDESATEVNGENKNHCEESETGHSITTERNRMNPCEEDSSNVQVSPNIGVTVTNTTDGNVIKNSNGGNRDDNNNNNNNIDSNKNSNINGEEDNHSVDSSQGNRKLHYESTENKTAGVPNVSAYKLSRGNISFCDSQEDNSDENMQKGKQRKQFRENSNSDVNDSEGPNYEHINVRERDTDNCTETENDDVTPGVSPFDNVNEMKGVGDKKVVNLSSQVNENKTTVVEMLQKSRPGELGDESRCNRFDEGEIVRELSRDKDVTKEERSYISYRNAHTYEHGTVHGSYDRKKQDSRRYYDQHMEKDLDHSLAKSRERNGRYKSRGREKERDRSSHVEFASGTEGKYDVGVKRESFPEDVEEGGIFVSGEIARKGLKKFKKMHKIGKVNGKKNGEDIFNILVSTETNMTSSNVSNQGPYFEVEDVNKSNEGSNNRCVSYGLAYMFVFHYYYILHKNKSLMHNLYAENAVLIVSANSVNLKFLKHNLFKGKLGIGENNSVGHSGDVPFENIESLYTEGVQINDNMLKLTNKELIDGYYNLLDVHNCTVHILSLEVVNFNEDLYVYLYGKIKRAKESDNKYHTFVQNIHLQKYNSYQYFVSLDFIHYYDSNTDDGFFVSTEEMKKMDQYQREQIMKSINQKKSEILKMKKQLSRPLVSGHSKKKEEKKGIKLKKKSSVKRTKKEVSATEGSTKLTKVTKVKSKKDVPQNNDANENKKKKKKEKETSTKTVVESYIEVAKKKEVVENENSGKAEETVVITAAKDVDTEVKKETPEVTEPKTENLNVVDNTNQEEADKKTPADDITKKKPVEEKVKTETEEKKRKRKKKNESVWNKEETKENVLKFKDIIKEETVAKNTQKKKKKQATVNQNSWVFRVMKNSNNADQLKGEKEGAKKETDQHAKEAKDINSCNKSKNSNAAKMSEGEKESDAKETTETDSEDEFKRKEREKISANEKKIIIHNVHKNMDKKKINDCIIERLKKYNDGHAVQIDIYERSSKKYYNSPYIYHYNANFSGTNKNGQCASGNAHASNSNDKKSSDEKINGTTNGNQLYTKSYERINIADYSYAIAELDCRQSQQLLLDLGLYCNGIKLNIEQFKDKKKESLHFGKRYGEYGGYNNSNNSAGYNGNNGFASNNNAAVDGKWKEGKSKALFYRGRGEGHAPTSATQGAPTAMNNYRMRRGSDRGF